MAEFTAFFEKHAALILSSVGKHILISVTAVVLGLIVALPAGVLLTKNERVAGIVLAVFGVVNTIPGLVLLGVAMMVLGLGFVPAVAVLFLYSLLPIMRNTYTGITGVDKKYIKAATGMGMSRSQLLRQVQIPLALPVILSGIRLSAVYIVSWATLSAFIGAGGLGDLIWMGLQSNNYGLVFSGALPATLIALLVSSLLTRAERLADRRSFRRVGDNP
jgi:osmoprotectant transport system permease protein